jgi:hypothetical protein
LQSGKPLSLMRMGNSLDTPLVTNRGYVILTVCGVQIHHWE